MSSTPEAIAEAACHIEIDVLEEPSGKQDQYVAAHGGICAYTFNADDTVDVEPLRLSAQTLEGMSDGFLLFFTGETRKATDILQDQDKRTRELDAEMVANLDRTKAIGLESRALLESGDLTAYGELMHEHWLNKRTRSAGMSTGRVDELYELARANGAVGGKLVGAGGGGFLLVYTPEPGPPARGDVRRRRRRGALRLRLPGRLRAGVRVSLRVGIVGCGADGPQARRRARRATWSWPSATPTRTGRPSSRSPPAARPVPDVEAVLAEGVDVVIVSTTHDALSDAGLPRPRGRRARAGREARRAHRGRGRPHRRRRRGRRAAW